MNAGEPVKDTTHLRARRRQARRRRRLARIDLGFGLLGAIVVLIATPGLAIAAIVALVVLALCALSFVLERRKRSRGARPGRSSAPAGYDSVRSPAVAPPDEGRASEPMGAERRSAR